jgi:hypothetical protein
MAFLPASIEAHLFNAGCTATELLVLRHLLDGATFTLRELAGKTGKSTGVLDQATKKLIGKRILRRESVNGTPKYALGSPDAILRWLREHTAQTMGLLQRREDDVHQFLSSVERDMRRPSVEYFEGSSGLERAYWQLLDAADREILTFLPPVYKEEEDPLRGLRERFTIMRRRKKIESRVITHDTMLGRRYRARDVFTHRQTVLVDPAVHPIPFEQAIAGDVLGCFSYEQERACLLRFPHLAEQQRALFEAFWSKTNSPRGEEVTISLDSITIAELEGCGIRAM